MGVRAKFYVESVALSADQGQKESTNNVVLKAAMGDDNKEWTKWTPSGSIQMQINNPAAVEQFKPGQYVDVLFEPLPFEPVKP